MMAGTDLKELEKVAVAAEQAAREARRTYNDAFKAASAWHVGDDCLACGGMSRYGRPIVTDVKVCYCGRAVKAASTGATPLYVHVEGPRQCWPDDVTLYAELDPYNKGAVERIVRDEDAHTWERISHPSLEDWQIDLLANAAQIYVDAFTDDDAMTLLEVMMLTGVKQVLEQLGRRQEWGMMSEPLPVEDHQAGLRIVRNLR
jgi:hypothetical protein